MKKSRGVILCLLVLFGFLGNIFFYSLRVNASPTLKTWTFEYTGSFVHNYQVIVTANDTWEVGTKQTVTLTVKIPSASELVYIELQTVEMGLILNTRKEVVNQIVKQDQPYTHVMTFYVTEDDYFVYENKEYERDLSFQLDGTINWDLTDVRGWIETVPLLNYEYWTIKVVGIEPEMTASFSATSVNCGEPIQVDVTVKYPSGFPIENCRVSLVMDFREYLFDYKNNGVYSTIIVTDQISPGEKEVTINVAKGLYYFYDLVPAAGEKYTLTFNSPTAPDTTPEIIDTTPKSSPSSNTAPGFPLEWVALISVAVIAFVVGIVLKIKRKK